MEVDAHVDHEILRAHLLILFEEAACHLEPRLADSVHGLICGPNAATSPEIIDPSVAAVASALANVDMPLVSNELAHEQRKAHASMRAESASATAQNVATRGSMPSLFDLSLDALREREKAKESERDRKTQRDRETGDTPRGRGRERERESKRDRDITTLQVSPSYLKRKDLREAHLAKKVKRETNRSMAVLSSFLF